MFYFIIMDQNINKFKSSINILELSNDNFGNIIQKLCINYNNEFRLLQNKYETHIKKLDIIIIIYEIYKLYYYIFTNLDNSIEWLYYDLTYWLNNCISLTIEITQNFKNIIERTEMLINAFINLTNYSKFELTDIILNILTLQELEEFYNFAKNNTD